ncbi:hypothetical protein METBIDRAFT_29396 [Metschnikowia bicuspidata var. bicuspidata NRRL YB-4993]|uniref:Amino acid transporter transmembrane domain-containing protein n=1 Tax=Metschnikowia bicuspidata var. bicuspidata NRRL YB-4993 TaxID=869754 RepID=A0A1A0HFA3_9ASCO|nr:hypothetical protein METBIDRAFT_29396 [Metschnikowia bicuspidata var. bicuspidata NRRL YB-4993]OBA22819.1 hypothetical protein METBIDRAFT_29396 [Metschnikowia bicuspidata var. bicuspidata NRRL YB-4993]
MSAIEDGSYDESVPLLSHRRQSILDMPLGLFRGPNTLHNFASSFTRAQLFAAHKLDTDLHKKRSFFAADSAASPQDELFDPDLMVALPAGERLSVLRAGAPPGFAHNEVFYQDEIASILHDRSRRGSAATGGIPIPTRRVYPAALFLLVRLAVSVALVALHLALTRVEDRDGNLVTVIAGQSTAPQTVLNSVNVLIGVGLLALPVGLLKGGWVLGAPLLVACCLATCWSATLLSRALDTDRTMMTYADLGHASYGRTAKALILVIFSVDLVGLGVSLVLLFSDSLFALAGDETRWTKTRFKLVAFAVLTPFTFLPLPVLLVFSLFGILATVSITVLVFCCGLLKLASPGSLIEAMPTNLWPQSTPELFVALGILMAPFGGHAIFPNLKSDMRHPEKFTRTLFTTYTITLLTDCSMAVIGFLMFGALCNNEVTSILLETAGYPPWIYPLISGLICIVPLAKTPLNAKPIISTLDGIFALDFAVEGEPALTQVFKDVCRFLVRVGVNALFVSFAIIFPEFDKIIGILGSSICFIICIILPCLFYLKLCKDQVQAFEKFYISAVILVSSVLAILCTYATIAY